jgi:hypothetical protein
MSKYITVAEAADLTSRHRQSIYNAVGAGLIRSKTVNDPTKRGGTQLLVLASDVRSADKRRIWRARNKS